MRFVHRPGLAFVLIAFVAVAACSRSPLGAGKPDASADGAGRAGTTGTDAGGKAGHAGAAGLTGAAGGNAGGAGGAAGSSGPCPPGQTICTGPTTAIACLPSGVWATDNTFCTYGCVNGLCHQCTPGDKICNTATTMQRCAADGLQWEPPVLCDNGCENGTCAEHCLPGFAECVDDSDVRTCGADGIWGVSVNCKFGCSNRACRACEPSTSVCLTAKSSRTCQDDGTWGTAVTCATACENGICTDCQQDAGMCVDDKSFRGCNANGTWDPPAPCESGICFGDGCRECKPGSTRCVDDDMLETCSSDGQFDEETACPNACKAGACTSNPKKVFVTSTTYKGGELGGTAGADAKCQARATAAGLTGTFRAWLSQLDSSPGGNFPRDGGPYLLVNGGVVANNWTGLTSGTLRHAINITELGTPAPTATVAGCTTPIVWTDTLGDGMVADLGLTCGEWTDSSGFDASWGTTSSQVDWTQGACMGFGTSAATGCGALAPLYCFEQ